MPINIELLRKIHAGGEDSCYIAILKNWKKPFMDDDFSDRLFSYDDFFKESEKILESDHDAEDIYFSINSFWKKSKSNEDIRHLNAFVLDFDFYKIEGFKDLDPENFYRTIKEKLPFRPTAAVSSGRGLYVIYAFHHCSKKRIDLYKSIYKSFYERFKDFGMDSKAMNLTQVIRMPGSTNPKGTDIGNVEILDFEDTDYQLTDFCSLLPYSRAKVEEYKKAKKGSKPFDLKKCRPSGSDWQIERSRKILEDMKKLAKLRNGDMEGYRECVLYLAREAMLHAGFSDYEQVEASKEINELFIEKMDEKEIECQCRPSKGRKMTSIKRMIEKLAITEEEQKELSYLKEKKMKDLARNYRKKRNKLVNLTEKQLAVFQRRTKVIALKRKGERNSRIADKLEISRSTVKKDLDYINENKAKFVLKIEEYMGQFLEALQSISFLRTITYDYANQLREWLELGFVALE